VNTPESPRLFRGIEPKAALLLLLLLGALFRLPVLGFPGSVVFDELHFGGFATAYCCSREYFFDIHPPHAKLLIAGAASLAGYEGGFGFDSIGRPFPEGFPVLAFRSVPAAAGILLPLVIFALVRLLGGSVAAAFAAGLLVTLDNAVWVQTQYILLDGVLWLSLFAAVAFMLRAQQLDSMRRRVPWLVLCGVAMAMAIGTKFTGLTAGLIVLALLIDEFLDRKTLAAALVLVRQAIWIGLPFLLVYLGGWWLHFHLLDQSGPGYAFYRPSGDFFQDLVRLHQIMLAANYNISVPHPDASVWWTWPFMAVPVLYWNQADRVIYFAGNPVVWWGTAAVGLTAVMVWLLQGITRLRLPEPASQTAGAADTPQTGAADGGPGTPGHRFWVLAIAFLGAFLPFVGIPRALFLYHYIPAFLFAMVFAVLWLERCGWTEPLRPLLRQPRRYWAVLFVAAVAFVLMLPLTGGVAGFEEWRSQIFRIFPTWR
jgi:dolichyl-phosphate-mannose-protein mannosyltransferase